MSELLVFSWVEWVFTLVTADFLGRASLQLSIQTMIWHIVSLLEEEGFDTTWSERWW